MPLPLLAEPTVMPYLRVERRGTGLVLSQAFGSTIRLCRPSPDFEAETAGIGRLRKRPANRLTEDRLDAPKAAIGRVRAGGGPPQRWPSQRRKGGCSKGIMEKKVGAIMAPRAAAENG